MKLHLPLSLRSSLLACMALVGFTMGASGAADFEPKTNLGDTMFVGDSITHGVNGKVSWRWNFSKILIDNNIHFNEVGVNRGGLPSVGTNWIYGNGVFQNVHSAMSGEHAYEITGRIPAPSSGSENRLDGTNIKQWLNFEPDTSPSGNRHIGADVTPSTYFLLIGTNDLLSDNHEHVSQNGKYERAKENLLGTRSEGNAWSGTGDMDTIINTMRKKSGEDVDIVVLTVPTWDGGRVTPGRQNDPADYECIREYNESLKAWGEWKGVKVVDINFGLVDVASGTGRAVRDFYPDMLHPLPQGELIIAGNVARGMGYAGRTAGQLRKGAADFSNRLTTIPATITAGTSSSYNWDGADLSHGFTVDFTLEHGVGNGSEGGWDTTHNFSVSVGDGEHYGTLNINEAYIQWGDTKLFSLDTSELTDSLRIAYVYGNTARNLPSGFYIWMDDQLIGELTSENDIRSGSAINGITITNSTANDITLKDLSWDGSGSWAPSTTNMTNGNPIIAGPGKVLDYGEFPGKKKWTDEEVKTGITLTNQMNVQAGLEGKIGGVVDSGSALIALMNSVDYKGNLYITLSGTTKIQTPNSNASYWGFHGCVHNNKRNSVFTGDGYLRVADLDEPTTFTTFFGTINTVESGGTKGGIVGNLYVEFSSPYLTIANNTYSLGIPVAIAGVYQAPGGISGTFRLVINDGAFGNIIGGSANEKAHVGAVEFFFNGGLYTGNIAAGGYFGSVGDRSITISGDTVSFSVATQLITAGAVPEGSNLFGTTPPTGTVDGSATVTLTDMTPEADFRWWKGTLSGGQKTTDGVRTLVFAGMEMEGLSATLENFDVLVVTTSEYTGHASDVGLSDLGGATEIQVTEGSRLTLLAGENGKVWNLTVNNDGTIALPKGVTLRMNTEYDAPTGSAWEVDGGKLILGDAVVGTHHVAMTDKGALEVGEVKNGTYTVEMSDSTMTVAKNAKGSYKLTMKEASEVKAHGGDKYNATMSGKSKLNVYDGKAEYTVEMSDSSRLNVYGGEAKYTVTMSDSSQLNVTGGNSAYTVDMSNSRMTVSANTKGVYDLTVRDAGVVDVDGGEAEYTVKMSGGSKLNVEGGEAEYTVEMSGKSLLNVTGGEGNYTVTATDAGNQVIVGDDVSSSFDLTMGNDSRLELGENTRVAAGSVKMGRGSSVTVGADSEGDWTVELGAGGTLTVGAGATGNYHIKLTGGGYINSLTSSISGVAVLNGAGTYDLKGGPAAGLKLNLPEVTAETHVINMGSGDVTLSGKNRITLSSSMQTAAGAPLDTTGKLRLDKDATLSINVNNIAADVQRQREGTYYLTRGDLSALRAEGAAGKIVFDAAALVLGWDIAYGEDGALHFEVPAPVEDRNIYQSSVDNDGSGWGIADGKSIYETVPAYKAILMDQPTTLDLSSEDAPDGVKSLVMHNLVGGSGCSLTVQDTNPAHNSKLTISNSISEQDKELLKAISGGVEIEDSLTFDGDITLSRVGLEVKHENPDKQAEGAPESRFIVGGNLVMDGDREVELTCGVLELHGAGNDLGRGDVIFNGAEGQLAIVGEQAQAVLGGEVKLAPGSEPTEREHILLTGGATLELSEGAEVGQGIVIGGAATAPDEEPSGTLTVSGEATIASEAKLRNVALRVTEHGVLHVGAAPETPAPAALALRSSEPNRAIAGLEGNGKLTAGAADMEITVAGSDRVFGGDLSEYAGTMTINAAKHSQVFSGHGLKGNSAWNLTNKAGGHLTLNLAQSNNRLTMGQLDLQSDSHTGILFDLTKMTKSSGLQLTQLNIAQNAHVTIGQAEGLYMLKGDKDEEVTIAVIKVKDPAASAVAAADVDWQLQNIKNDDGRVYTEYDSAAGVLYLKTRVETLNPYVSYAQNANAAAGAQLLGGISSAEIGGDLAGVDVALARLLRGENGRNAANVATANRIMAAAAGASTAVLGQAVIGDVERQLRAIRNRTTSSGVNPATTSAVWFNAESDYHKMNADGMLPGYKVSSWGGTVGAGHSVGRNMEIGLALTAMYADLESYGPDRIKGDMDTHYVSAYAQVVHGAWRHTLVATVGASSIDADRTVNYGEGSYTTSGSTDGTSFGALYEVGYSVPLGTEGAMYLQPVVNVALRHTKLDAYTESGSTAALNVNAQKNTVLTLGLGARLQAALSGNFWNRTSYLEGRALVKIDCGDRNGESRVAFREAGAARSSVHSTDKGAVGVELGAGLTVPVGRTDEVFVDVGAELRSGYTNANATVGYKVGF